MSAYPTLSTPGTPAPGSRELDRRTFLGTVGLTAGAVIAASVAPLAAARAADGILSAPSNPAPAKSRANPAFVDAAQDVWDVDDMWGNRPRYAQPIPYAHGIPGAGTLERSGPYFERRGP